MSYRYKCTKRINGKQCFARVSLPKRIEEYIHVPKCPRCGNELTYRDKSRERESKKDMCRCDGYWFPHRKGSRYCVHNENITEEDLQDRYYNVPQEL